MCKTLLLFIISISFYELTLSSENILSYRQNGYDWDGVCATGKAQSPINIGYKNVTYADEAFPRIKIETMGITKKLNIFSTGTSLEVKIEKYELEPEIAVPATKFMVANDSNIKSGTLLEVEIVQFHFHTVSEHSFKGRLYPGELHIVTRVKKGQTETCDKIDCLSVFGIFLKYPFDINEEKNDVMSKIFENIPEKEAGEEYGIELNQKLDINELLPEIKHYFTYDGSLTTPPCTESVLWIVFNKAITMTEKQVYFHQMMVRNLPGDDCDLVETDDELVVAEVECEPNRPKVNNRPVQPLNGRILTYVDMANS